MTLGDVYQAVKDLERRLERGSVSVQARSVGDVSQTVPDEPADVAASLDTLGL